MEETQKPNIELFNTNGSVEVTYEAALLSVVIKDGLEASEGDGMKFDVGEDEMADMPRDVIPWPVDPKISESTLLKIGDFLTKYSDPQNNARRLFTRPINNNSVNEQDFFGSWNHAYISFCDQPNVNSYHDFFNLMEAANFLNIELLLELCYAFLAFRIKNKTPEEIRIILKLGVDNKPSLAYERDIIQNNSWINKLRYI